MQHHWTYAMEFAAIWVFGIFWIVKSFEIRQGDADLTYLLEELERRPGSPDTKQARVAV